MPSLVQFLHSEEWINKAYKRAKQLASAETGIEENVFSVACPYTEQQIIDFNFLPLKK